VLAVIAPIYFISRTTGWLTLAERYPSTGTPPAARTWLGYGVFRGWMGYNGALIVSSDATALYLSTWPLFSWCHPAIQIPWREVSELREEGGFWGARVTIRTIGAPDVDFALRPRTFALVRDDAKQAGVPGNY